MDQDQDPDNAYAQGRSDASTSGDGTGTAGKILVAIVTGVTADLTSLKQVHYNPPKGEAAKAAYNRGWKDQYEK